MDIGAIGVKQQHSNKSFNPSIGCLVRNRFAATENRRTGRVRGQRYPLTYNGTKTAWQRVRADAGLTDFRLLRETGNLKLTQKALNHRDIKSTLRYAHVLDDDVADAVERVARRKMLGKPLGKIREVG
jgi:integrase